MRHYGVGMRPRSPVPAVARGVALALALGVSLALAGCTEDQADGARRATPVEQLTAARDQLLASAAVTFTVVAEDLPDEATGVSGAEGVGTFRPPAFQGTLDATVGGVTGKVEVIAVERDVYMKFFTPDYNPIDPADYGAPNPAQLLNPETGITSVVEKTQGLVRGERTRDGAEVLDTFTGTLPGAVVADLLVIGDRQDTYDVTYGVTAPGGDLRSVQLVGPFYPGTESTYTLRLEESGELVAISRP